MFKSFQDNRGKFTGQPGQTGPNRGIFPGQTGPNRGKPGHISGANRGKPKSSQGLVEGVYRRLVGGKTTLRAAFGHAVSRDLTIFALSYGAIL